MGVAERRAREKHDLRQSILHAASEMLIQEGYEGVSIRKIAEKIEYSPATIYLHFKDKAQLIGSICEEVFSRLNAALAEINERVEPPREKMHKSLCRYVEFALENAAHYVVIFCLPDPAPEQIGTETYDNNHHAGMACFDRLRKGVIECMESGAFRRQDPELVSQSVWVMVHGIASALITKTSFPFVDRQLLVEKSVNTILAGLA